MEAYLVRLEMTTEFEKRPVSDVGTQVVRNKLSRGRQRLDVPDSPFMDRVLKWILQHNVEHVHGPSEVDYDIDELVVLVLLRNGRPYVKPFIEHYLALGAKHIVFLDNGSIDGTVEALKAYDQNITVLHSGLPYKKYNVTMKQYLVERFGRGRWTLSTDMDELFEYPYSDVVSLKSLLGYLNEHSYTAVVTYMLDMFPETLLPAEGSADEYEDLKEMYRFYDISDVRTRDYSGGGEIGNVVSNEQIKILQGGVNERIFGTSPLLTKHPLVFLDDRVRPHDLSDHWVGNARIADFTALFLHYKLSANIYHLVRMEIEERRYVNRHGKYDRMHKVLAEAPSLLMRNETSKELKSVNDLVGTRFVSVSKQYISFVESEAQKNGRYSEELRSERLSEAFFNARAEVASYGWKIRDQRQELRKMRARSRRRRAASRRVRRAEEQINAIQSSRTWKALTAIHRIRLGAAEALDRVRAWRKYAR